MKYQQQQPTDVLSIWCLKSALSCWQWHQHIRKVNPFSTLFYCKALLSTCIFYDCWIPESFQRFLPSRTFSMILAFQNIYSDFGWHSKILSMIPAFQNIVNDSCIPKSFQRFLHSRIFLTILAFQNLFNDSCIP